VAVTVDVIEVEMVVALTDVVDSVEVWRFVQKLQNRSHCPAKVHVGQYEVEH
jgi:hypothetical protein